jgi:hypothetical protein
MGMSTFEPRSDWDKYDMELPSYEEFLKKPTMLMVQPASGTSDNGGAAGTTSNRLMSSSNDQEADDDFVVIPLPIPFQSADEGESELPGYEDTRNRAKIGIQSFSYNMS